MRILFLATLSTPDGKRTKVGQLPLKRTIVCNLTIVHQTGLELDLTVKRVTSCKQLKKIR